MSEPRRTRSVLAPCASAKREKSNGNTIVAPVAPANLSRLRRLSRGPSKPAICKPSRNSNASSCAHSKRRALAATLRSQRVSRNRMPVNTRYIKPTLWAISLPRDRTPLPPAMRPPCSADAGADAQARSRKRPARPCAQILVLSFVRPYRCAKACISSTVGLSLVVIAGTE